MLSASRSQGRSLLNSLPFSRDALFIIGGLILGATLVKAPVVTWALLGALLGLILLQAPGYILVGAAVLAAALSRVLVATGLAPGILNFFHFPLALGAAFGAATRGASYHPAGRSIATGLVALLFVSFASWVLNGGELLRPLLNWLVFFEPFLLIYAIVRTPFPLRKDRILWKLVLTIAFMQLPLGVWQALTLGLGDDVQGTFVGMGAGHHVAGAVTLIGALICVARGLSVPTFIGRLTWLLGGILLFMFPILSDAKQTIYAFLPALTLLLFMFLRIRWTRLAVALPVLAFAVLGAFSYYRPLQVIGEWERITNGIMGKVEAFTVIVDKAFDNPGGLLFGLGPGNSVSRVALMGMEGYVKPDSPVYLLGLGTARATEEIWALTASNWLFASSSVWSGISSWLGLFGDLGVIGLGLYLWMSWTLWRHLKDRRSWQIGSAKAVLIMAGLLGAMYSWLEEPGFTLLAAALVGLGLIASGGEDATDQNPGCP